MLRSVLCGVVVAVATAVLLATGADDERASASAGSSCKKNYDYAGVQNQAPASGIRAYLTTAKKPNVKAGHIAGWVGVGGPGLGPNGTDVWLQIGYSGFDTGNAEIYYEVALPNKAPTYHTVKANLSPSAKNLLTVLEVGNKHGSWKVWLNNKAVSAVIELPKSHAKFPPQAIGETWNGGTTKCNVWGYGFGSVEISAKPGGNWKNGKAGYVWQNAQQKAEKTSATSFTARSIATGAAAAPGREPPLLGSGGLLSKLLGHRVETRCVSQSPHARERPGLLLLSTRACSILLGWAVAQPRAPKAGTLAALEAAETTLGVLRVIARAAGVPPARTDCRAVGLFYRAFRGLGTTSGEALALRAALLDARSSVSPPLALPAGCPIG